MRTYTASVTNVEGEAVVLVTKSAAKMRQLRAGARWRYKGRPYVTTGIVPLTQHQGESKSWEVRGIPAD
jgi:hypothetical protein